MTIDDQIEDEKLQYDINREAAKISALSSGKINKYEYLTGEEILPSNQQKKKKKQSKLNLLILFLVKLSRHKQKQLKIEEKKQIKVIQNQGEIKTIKKHAHSDKDEKFNEFDHGFSIFDKIRDGKRSLADAKNYQAEF